VPATPVTDREESLYAGGGRPSEPFARFCGQLRVGWLICEPGDAQAKGLGERLQRFLETSFEPGRVFASHVDFQEQLDRWFDERTNRRLHRTLRRRLGDLLSQERESMRGPRQSVPELDRRKLMRVLPTPTCASTPTTSALLGAESGALFGVH
jgi:Integrase core domain